MPETEDERLEREAPDEVKARAQKPPREPQFDPRAGVGPIALDPEPTPKNRLVVLGDSLSHGFQSGAIFNTDISYPAIIARELGWFGEYRYPRYDGAGGLGINIEYVLRDLERRFGAKLDLWELPAALFRARQLMDEIEDYWERGPGSKAPSTAAYNHALAVFGWDLRDALDKTAARCREAIGTATDDPFNQVVEKPADRAAMRVYAHSTQRDAELTLLDTARALGEQRDDADRHGIETLIVFLGANNALEAVTDLSIVWSGPGYDTLEGKADYTVWQPEHFRKELKRLADQVAAIAARHVIWVTVPHVTIAPVARGVGEVKVKPGSRYFEYYTRPWIDDDRFDARQDPHITARGARYVDSAIDLYNAAMEALVRGAREHGRDWYLFDIAGVLDRLAHRRYIDDKAAQPKWWTPYVLPPELQALDPEPDSRFLTGDGDGGRETGGLFSLDGVHPTTIGYGLIAQELIDIMRLAGVEFRHTDGTPRPDPITVDFDWLIRRDSLIRTPPQNLRPGLATLGWGDEALDWINRALGRS